ncbi:uncharacterized protein LOC106011137 [Aplysia californica]|uniref:Uncharacterized protein LOC106011137 n=1 Tax=Aplysia californica TaxID=6500 RepID=A0ABM0ZVA2_APLCA|nr:uncharacterized protein LOC106011137 [Aplysia californica]
MEVATGQSDSSNFSLMSASAADQHTPSGSADSTGMLSTHTREMVEVVLVAILSTVIGVMGVVANCINLLVFLRQGFRETINISLTALAISDIGVLLTWIFLAICYNPIFLKSDAMLFTRSSLMFAMAWSSVCFTRITGCITAFITIERCLCIVAPLRIKRLITRRTTSLAMIFIFATVVSSWSILYTGVDFAWAKEKNTNRTLLHVFDNGLRNARRKVAFSYGNTIQCVSFILVVFFTSFMIVRLRKQAKWRSSTSAFGGETKKEKSGGLSTREARLVRMVVFISVILIVSSGPGVANLIAASIVPELSVMGRYANWHGVVWSVASLLSVVNSSVNIFVYYSMSSTYRAQFKQIFSRYPRGE